MLTLVLYPQNQPISLRIIPLSHIDAVLKHMEEPQKKTTKPNLTVVVDDDEEDADMTMPISGHVKRMEFVSHGPMGAKRRKMNTPAPKEIPAPRELPKMQSTSPEVSKSASHSSQHDEEVMDAFWDTLPRVDDTTSSTVVGLSPDGKGPAKVDPSCPTGVPTSAAQTSLTTPTPPQNLKVQRSFLDSINEVPDARIAASYAWVDEGIYPRDNEILLATDPRRLRGAMMVNLTEGQKLHRENGELLKQADTHKNLISSLSVEVEEEKRKREKVEEKTRNMKRWEDEEDIANLQRDLQGKIDAESRSVQELSKVQSTHKSAEQMVTSQGETIKELRAINQMLKEIGSWEEEVEGSDGLARVIGLWFKNGISFCTAQVKDLMQRAEKNLSILKGLNMGKKIDFPIEPSVSYPEEYLPSHSSNAKLLSPFKFLKDWIEEEEKKDQPETSRRSSRKR
ncbi:hypothetical protein Dimus_002991 [Dionaea muscipula]